MAPATPALERGDAPAWALLLSVAVVAPRAFRSMPSAGRARLRPRSNRDTGTSWSAQ